MTKLPVEAQRIGQGLGGNLVPVIQCMNPYCHELAVEHHHIVRRSYLAGAFPLVEIDDIAYPNIATLCRNCHDLVDHGGENIQLVGIPGDANNLWGWFPREGEWEFLNPQPKILDERRAFKEAEELAEQAQVCPHVLLEPGQVCEGCGYRKKHPRKRTSPVSKPYPVHIPQEEHAPFVEILQGAAEYIDALDKPHFAWKTISLALWRLLQDPDMKNWVTRQDL